MSTRDALECISQQNVVVSLLPTDRGRFGSGAAPGASARFRPRVINIGFRERVNAKRARPNWTLTRGSPTLATLVRPRSVAKSSSSVSEKRPGLAALVGHEGAVRHFSRCIAHLHPRALSVDLVPNAEGQIIYRVLCLLTPPPGWGWKLEPQHGVETQWIFKLEGRSKLTKNTRGPSKAGSQGYSGYLARPPGATVDRPGSTPRACSSGGAVLGLGARRAARGGTSGSGWVARP